MSRGIPWEWRRARGAISRRIALQPVHFHIKRTRERGYLASQTRPRTTREAGARAPSANAVPLRLLDTAAVAVLTGFTKAPHYSSHKRFPQPLNNDNCWLVVGGSCGCGAGVGRLRFAVSPNFSPERCSDA